MGLFTSSNDDSDDDGCSSHHFENYKTKSAEIVKESRRWTKDFVLEKKKEARCEHKNCFEKDVKKEHTTLKSYIYVEHKEQVECSADDVTVVESVPSYTEFIEEAAEALKNHDFTQ